MSKDDGITDTEIALLRSELKQWEKQFTDTHDGRKPGREDIKQDAVISKTSRMMGEWQRVQRLNTYQLPNTSNTIGCAQPQVVDLLQMQRRDL
jgi:hypothetical protein